MQRKKINKKSTRNTAYHARKEKKINKIKSSSQKHTSTCPGDAKKGRKPQKHAYACPQGTKKEKKEEKTPRNMHMRVPRIQKRWWGVKNAW
jgi:hypothetical protein